MTFPDLSKRLIVSFLSLAILAVVLIFAYNPIVMWVLAIGVALMGAVGIWEYGKLTKLDEKQGFLPLLITFGVLVIFSFFLSTFKMHFSLLPLIVLCVALVLIFFYHFNKIEGATVSIAQGFFGILYVAVPLGFALKILYLYSSCLMGHQGRYWILYLLVVTKITDVGAYFGGRMMGNRKLAPQLSPGKTVAGAIVGFICAIIFSLLFYGFGHFLEGFHLTLAQSLWLGALLGVMGQIGDLAESLFKRDADVKDSNRLPGFGGVLDMLDSLIFTIPIIYLFLYVC